ncbi:glycerol-3-phosphate dehydrogenase subunit GlpB [Candidatus Gracilibacteria bacterium]|nr:glycerol-3-phosphate dehydrogenase subunit GlpB [Candidatus Gracilibacteria bacterium]
MYDTIVIGAGLSGLMAGIMRAERGERVLVLAKGHGTTHWASGCVDLYDSAASPLAAIEQLATEQPDHPYAIAGRAAVEAAFAKLRALCADAGYPLAGSLERNLLLPSAVGALRPTCFAPATMVAGDGRQLAANSGQSAPLLIAGFRDLRDFFPQLIAENLSAQGYTAAAAYLDLPPTSRSKEFTTTIFARLFEEDAFREHVGQQLRRLVKDGRFTRIGLPAILGQRHATQVLADLQARCGALIFEIPTLPTSVPGSRIYQVLADAFETRGGRVQLGSKVERAEGGHGQLQFIYSEAAAREQRHRADRYILATGGVVGGGLRGDYGGTLHETALGLPVHTPAHSAWFDPRFLNDSGHPVFRSGVAVDRTFRPVDEQGAVIYNNVAVVGSALANADAIREGCLEGLAVATGYAAGIL